MNSNGAIWLDYDRDGLLDLYVTAYFRDDVDLDKRSPAVRLPPIRF